MIEFKKKKKLSEIPQMKLNVTWEQEANPTTK